MNKHTLCGMNFFYYIKNLINLTQQCSAIM
jgi:hypothetical protein